MHTSLRHRAARGMTLIEAMMAMAVLMIGAGGIVSAQLMAVRQNTHGKRVTQATTLMNDLQENILMWDYNDARLSTTAVITDIEAAEIEARLDMGAANPPTQVADYSEIASDAAATKDDALGTYAGYPTYYTESGEPALVRYWNVYEVNFESAGVSDGKLIQIIVRWQDTGFGFRQISSTIFKRNPAKASLL